MTTLHDFFGDPIHTYTRAEAIADGVLVDVTETAREAGFRVPVAITRTLWDSYITPAPQLLAYGQSETGRLWDVLWMLRCAITAKRGQGAAGRELQYTVLFLMPRKANSRATRYERVTLKAVSGPGDHGEPVITIMLPTEEVDAP